MTDLTEQMKIGKLPEGYYYLKLNPDFEDRYCVAYNMGMDFYLYAKGLDIDEVLAPVPTFEEWKKAYECVVSENEEITTLKELLKEWAQFEIEENPNDFTVMSERMSELANKTKEVLK